MALNPIPITADGSGPTGAIPVDLYGVSEGVDYSAQIAALETAVADLLSRVEALESA